MIVYEVIFLIEVMNVSKSYNGKVKAVDNLSFSVKEGEILGIVGLNGSGKSTTFRMILQLLTPDEGCIMYNHKEIGEIDRKIFGYLPEERSLYRDLSVYRQLQFLGHLKGMNDEEIDLSIKRLVELTEFAYDLNKTIRQLSKGNQQKVQLMGALIHNPQVIILDEPFSGMDPYNVEMLKQLFMKLQKEGKIILLSTHRLDHVESFCNSLLFLKNGKTIIYGKVDEIRKESGKHVISVVDDIPYFKLADLVGDERIQKEGNSIKVYCDDEKAARKYMKKILDTYDTLSITYSYLTLEDIFMEMKHEQF